MSLNVLADVADVISIGSRPGTEGYAVQDSGNTEADDSGLMHEVSDEPGNPAWVLAREWIAVNGEQPEVSDETWEADLTSAQTRRKDEVNREARYLLNEYDWYRLREADGGSAMPAAVLTYRNGVRTESNTAETAIDALVTVDACRDFVPSWPVAP